MTQEEVQAFCANNGISVSAPGQPLHVVDPTQLPASVRKFVNDDGSYAGNDTPEAEDKKSDTKAATTAKASATEAEDLSELTVVELKDRAREMEISGASSMSKDDLIKAIKKANK